MAKFVTWIHIHEKHKTLKTSYNELNVLFQVNLCGGGTTTRTTEDVGCVVVQAARDRCAGAANSRPGRREFASNDVKHKTVVRIEHPETKIQRENESIEQRGGRVAAEHR